MFLKDFKKEYNNIYEYKYYIKNDFNYKIIITKNKKTNIYLDFITIEIKRNSLNIFKEYIGSYYDDVFKLYSLNYNKLLFIQNLKSNYQKKPKIHYKDKPYKNLYISQIGYFNLSHNLSETEKIINIIENVLINEISFNLDKIYFMKYFTKEYLNFIKYEQELFISIGILLGNNFSHILNSNILNKEIYFSEKDIIFLNSDNTIVIGNGKKQFDKMSKIINIYDENYILEENYFGIKYFIARYENKLLYADINIIKNIEEFIKASNIYSEFPLIYKYNKQNFLIVQYGEFWAFICLLKKFNNDLIVSEEFEKIKSLNISLKKFMPLKLLENNIDINKLDAALFEKMCCDILDNMGFKNIFLRGSTNTADGGIDIEADEEIQSLFGYETRHWIFQCKHTKSQIDRKDISEIPDLIKEFHAYGYGIFYSGIFTPQTLDRIKRKNCKIICWGKNEIELMLGKSPKIVSKYFNI